MVWLPKERVLFAGDCVEFGATPYCGDARFADWPGTLDAIQALGPERLVPGCGRSLMNAQEVRNGVEGTRAFTSDLFGITKHAVAAGKDLHATYQDVMAEMRPKYVTSHRATSVEIATAQVLMDCRSLQKSRRHVSRKPS